jgi:hypothetical protein
MIKPPHLLDREAELAELARFCLAPEDQTPDGTQVTGDDTGRGRYAWWQAPAWSGKSALLATFALEPPAAVRDQVTIVSFFITARLADRDNRNAFIRDVSCQLVELLASPAGSRAQGASAPVAPTAVRSDTASSRLYRCRWRGPDGPAARPRLLMMPADTSLKKQG